MRQDEVQLEKLKTHLELPHSFFWYMGHHVGSQKLGSDLMPENMEARAQNDWISGYHAGLKQREDQHKMNKAKMKHEIAVAAVLFDNKGSILLQHRSKDPGSGLFVLVGGMLDESDPREGLSREVKEEIGLDIPAAQFTPVYSALDKRKDGAPLIMLYFACRIERGTERNMEPHKCQGLHWFRPHLLPTQEMWANDRGAISFADSLFDFRRMGVAK